MTRQTTFKVGRRTTETGPSLLGYGPRILVAGTKQQARGSHIRDQTDEALRERSDAPDSGP